MRTQLIVTVSVAVICWSSHDLLAQNAKAKAMLHSFVGKWEGDCKTWLRPDEAPDESTVTGEIRVLTGTDVVRHSYKGSFGGKERIGEETIAFNTPEDEFQVSWFDTFHMNYALLISVGHSNKDGNGFVVSSKYRMDATQEYWKWRTEYLLEDANNLVITAYNISPQGQEAKAVEVRYRRVSS